MKKNNKGFIMTEALIISAVVLTALILIYAQFVKIDRAYSNEYKNNNVNGIYKLNQIGSFLDEDGLDTIPPTLDGGYKEITDCKFASNTEQCKMLIDAADIKHLLFGYNNKSLILSKLNQHNPYKLGFTNFLKTIDDTDLNYGYQLIAEFFDGSYAAIPYGYGISTTRCDIEIGRTWTFGYINNSYHSFEAPCNATYKIELWGASGGDATYGTNSKVGGLGGYTAGDISLLKNNILYIYVGGEGGSHNGTSADTLSGGTGYNGGSLGTFIADDSAHGGGGGATDVRYFSVSPSRNELAWDSILGLNSRIMVAAGGAGASAYNNSSLYSNDGPAAGGLHGEHGERWNECEAVGKRGEQYYGGSAGFDGCQEGASSVQSGVFGKGGSNYYAGGGSGLYGGGSGKYASGGSGSSYISGHAGCLAYNNSSSDTRGIKSGCDHTDTSVECSVHSSGKQFTNTVMIDGAGYAWTTTKAANSIGMPKYNETGSMVGNDGNGYARITLVAY